MPWQLKAAIIGATFVVGMVSGWAVNGWRLNANIADLKASYAKSHAAAQQAARDKEQALNARFDKLRKDKDAQINAINNRLANALDGVQNRPSRPGAMPDNAQSGNSNKSGCSPAELYRQDAEFLIKFSAATEELKEGLKYCIAQYNAAREIINK